MLMRVWMTATVLSLFFAGSLCAQDAPKKGGDLLDKKKDDKAKDKKKDGKTDTKKDKKKDVTKTKKLEYGTVFVGQVTRVGNRGPGDLALRVTYNRMIMRSDARKRVYDYQRSLAQRQQDLARKMYNIQRERNPRTRQRLIYEYQRALRKAPPRQPELYEKKTFTQNINVRLGGKVIVRTNFPEPMYDNKGNLVKFTPELIKKIRGPEGYPGFPAKRSTLQNGQTLQIFLKKVKMPKRTKGKDKKKAPNIGDILGKGKKKSSPNDVLVDASIPEAVMVVVVKDGGR